MNQAIVTTDPQAFVIKKRPSAICHQINESLFLIKIMKQVTEDCSLCGHPYTYNKVQDSPVLGQGTTQELAWEAAAWFVKEEPDAE